MNKYAEELKPLYEVFNQKVAEQENLKQEQEEAKSDLMIKENEILVSRAYIEILEYTINLLKEDIKSNNYKIFLSYDIPYSIVSILSEIALISNGITNGINPLLSSIILGCLILFNSYGLKLCKTSYLEDIKEDKDVNEIEEELTKTREKLESLTKEKQLIQDDYAKKQSIIDTLNEEINLIKKQIELVLAKTQDTDNKILNNDVILQKEPTLKRTKDK